MILYDPNKHIIGHTYWEKDPRTTHRPIRFKYFVDEDLNIYVVKIDARRESYMVNFGGCYSQVYCGSIVTEEVSNRRLFLCRDKAQRFIDDIQHRSCFAAMMHDL
jgi:hypothetical protein